jgi:hypothetical protein
MLERLSTNGALVRTFTHVVNWKEIKIDMTMVYFTNTQLKTNSVHTSDMTFHYVFSIEMRITEKKEKLHVVL